MDGVGPFLCCTVNAVCYDRYYHRYQRINMKDVMIDFETFGTGTNACVVQVGACYFDRQTSAIGPTLKLNIDADSALRSGAVMDASTVYWWLSQSPEAIKSITEKPRKDINEAFITLNTFLSGAEYIWSHATFDYVILTETLRRLSITPGFSYRAARDIRTIADLAGIDAKTLPRTGVHHDGLDDCIFQVSHVVACLNKLKDYLK